MAGFAMAKPEQELFPPGALQQYRRDDLFKLCIEKGLLTEDNPTPKKDVMIAMLNGDLPVGTVPKTMNQPVTLASAHTDNPVPADQEQSDEDIFG